MPKHQETTDFVTTQVQEAVERAKQSHEQQVHHLTATHDQLDNANKAEIARFADERTRANMTSQQATLALRHQFARKPFSTPSVSALARHSTTVPTEQQAINVDAPNLHIPTLTVPEKTSVTRPPLRLSTQRIPNPYTTNHRRPKLTSRFGNR